MASTGGSQRQGSSIGGGQRAGERKQIAALRPPALQAYNPDPSPQPGDAKGQSRRRRSTKAA